MREDRIINIIIADDNKSFRDILEERIEKEPGFNLVTSVENGTLVYEEILKGYADVVILDMIMPELDGLAVLEKVKGLELTHRPHFIFFSGIDETKLAQRALEMGASYYLKKPFDLDVLIERIRNLKEEKDSKNIAIDNEINGLITKLGIQKKLKGYVYIKKAIWMVFKNKGSMGSITKTIYPKIANEFKTTDKNVERSIRNCIERAYKENALGKTYQLFNLYRKPTNSEFIMKVASKLMLMFGDEI